MPISLQRRALIMIGRLFFSGIFGSFVLVTACNPNAATGLLAGAATVGVVGGDKGGLVSTMAVSATQDGTIMNGRSEPAGLGSGAFADVAVGPVSKSYMAERDIITRQTTCYGRPGCGFSESSADNPLNNVPYAEFPTPVGGDPKTVSLNSGAGAGVVTTKFSASLTASTLVEAMGFSASLAARYSVAKASSSFSRLTTKCTTKNSITICLSCDVRFGLDGPAKTGNDLTLTDAAKAELAKGKANFASIYGTHYVDTAEKGARVVLVFTCAATSERAFSAITKKFELDVKTPTAGGSANLAFAAIRSSDESEWKIGFEVFGANVDFSPFTTAASNFIQLKAKGEAGVDSLESAVKELMRSSITRETADYVSFTAIPHPCLLGQPGPDPTFWGTVLNRRVEAADNVTICDDLASVQRMRRIAGEQAFTFDVAAQMRQAAKAFEEIGDVVKRIDNGEQLRLADIPNTTNTCLDATKWIADQEKWQFSDWLALSSAKSLTRGIWLSPDQRRTMEAVRAALLLDDDSIAIALVVGNRPLKLLLMADERMDSTIDLAPLATLSKLQSLSVTVDRNTSLVSLRPVERLIGLQHLELIGMSLSSIDFLSGCVTNLESLVIKPARSFVTVAKRDDWPDYVVEGLKDVSILATAKKLRRLSLSGAWNLSNFKPLESLPLTHLDLSLTAIDISGVRSISKIVSITDLTLRVTRNLTDWGFVLELKSLLNLSTLDITLCGARFGASVAPGRSTDDLQEFGATLVGCDDGLARGGCTSFKRTPEGQPVTTLELGTAQRGLSYHLPYVRDHVRRFLTWKQGDPDVPPPNGERGATALPEALKGALAKLQFVDLKWDESAVQGLFFWQNTFPK